MGYTRAVLLRWSRRDRLATIVIAVAVASLVGTALVLVAAGAQSAAIAGQYTNSAEVTYYESASFANSKAASSDIVLPVSRVTTERGETRTIVGVSRDIPSVADDWSLRSSGSLERITDGTISSSQDVTLSRGRTTVTLRIVSRPSGATIFPDTWYVTDATTVREFGSTGALVIHEEGTTSSGTPLLSALVFFQDGTTQAIRTLTATAVGSALLVGVTIYSVTRMSIRDRRTTIRVARSTGAPPHRILALFTGRAFLLTGVGLAVGYAVGVILPSAAVNIAIALGVPVALPVQVTGQVALTLLPILGGLLLVGLVAGLLGTWPTVRHPPGTPETSTTDSKISSWLPQPRLVGWRAVVPTMTTLAAFVTFVVILSAIAGVVAPLVAGNGATITEPGSKHPVSSHVPESYATALHQRGIDASPEILLFEVARGTPFPARGVNYSAFANVTDAHLVTGRPPHEANEAVIGTDLADTLGVEVGDTLTLGGSTAPAVARVEIVGTFAAPNPYDDQLLTTLPLARHLTSINSPTAVNLIRADRLPQVQTSTDQTTVVSSVSVPTPLVQNNSTPVTITVRNTGTTEASATLPIQLANRTHQVTLTVPPTGKRTTQVSLPTDTLEPGTYRLRVGSQTQSVQLVAPDALVLRGLPSTAPPDSEPLVRVLTATNDPISTAQLSVNGTSVTTNQTGYVRLPLSTPGRHHVRVQKGERETNATLVVRTGASRQAVSSLRITPTSPTTLTAPQAQISLYNPWNTTLTRRVTVTGPETSQTRSVTLDPAERTTLTTTLNRQPPGSYQVDVRSGAQTLATTSYTVTGDDRIASTLASSGRTDSTGLGQAITVAFGNIWVVLATILGLAGLMTVGGTTATFAQAIHARRQSIGVRMATGATRRQIFMLVGRDAVLVGSVASGGAVLLGLVIVKVLDWLGYLTVFGVTLSTIPSLEVLLVTVGASILLTVLGATLTLLGLMRRSPSALLADQSPTHRTRRSDK